MDKEYIVKSYFYESFMNHKDYFEIHENGIQYKPHNKSVLFVQWEDIGRIVARFGDKVVIYDLEQKELFRIKYSTANFTELIEEICKKLSIAQKNSLSRIICKRNILFPAVLNNSVGGVLVFLAICYICLFHPFSLMVVFFLAYFGLFMAIQFNKVILEKNQVILKNLQTNRSILFTEISKVNLEKIYHYKVGEFLYVIIELNTGEKIKLRLYKDLLQLFITLNALIEQ